MADVNTTLFVIAAIIFIGYGAAKAFEKFKIPDIILLMLLGLLIGPGLGIFGPEAVSTLRGFGPLFGTLVLVILLVEGGMSLNYKTVLKEAAPSTLFTFLAFAGTMLSIAAVSMLFGWPLLHALLLGAILGGNSSSIVMALVRRIDIKEETRTVLSLESSINDAFTIIMSVTLIQIISGTGVASAGAISQSFFGSFTISALFAVVAALVWLKILNVLQAPKYNYLLTLAAALMLYTFTEWSRSSGAFAALVFGIMLGNSKVFYKLLRIKEESLMSKWNLHVAQEEITFFVRTFFFVFIGLVLDLTILSYGMLTLAVLIIAVKAGARYGSARTLARFKPEFTADESVLTIMLPSGLAAAAMAAYPATFGITFGGQDLFLQVAFLVILLSNMFSSIAVFKIETKKRTTMKKISEQLSQDVQELEEALPKKRKKKSG